MSSDSRRRETMEFRYEPAIDSPDAVLLRFLKKGTSVRGGKELILHSIRAYWMAIAYQQSNEAPERVRTLALECCQALREQIRYLETHFNLGTDLTRPVSMPAVIQPVASTSESIESSETESIDQYGLGMQASAQERRSFLSS